MYKLFLCLRYLRSRVIAYFAVLAVALCVAMMLIVISVMNGFLHKIETAAKGLFGDVIVDAGGLSGIPYYDEFIAEVRSKVPEVEDGTPFILTGGILESRHFTNRQLVQIAGIRLAKPAYDPATKKYDFPSRQGSYATVSDFGKGLFFQSGGAMPTFDPDFSRVAARLRLADWQIRWSALELVKPYAEKDPTYSQYYNGKMRAARDWAWSETFLESKDKPLPPLPSLFEISERWYEKLKPEEKRMLDRLEGAEAVHLRSRRMFDGLKEPVAFDPLPAEGKDPVTAPPQDRMRQLQAMIDRAAAKPSNDAQVDQLTEELNKAGERVGILPAEHHAILGVSLYSFRTPDGTIIRQMLPGDQITLTMIPLGKKGSSTTLTPEIQRFTVIDDSRTDVSSIDSGMVYVPFETLQRLNKMEPQRIVSDDPNAPVRFTPGRCNQIQIKVKNPAMSEQELQAVRQEIANLWIAFRAQHSDAESPTAQDSDVQTWRQRQMALISQIASQRTLVVVMFGIISGVAVVLIFVIFYMIVFQKTKDIGVVKSLGASSTGVAGIFLGYGAAVGLVGSIIGVLGGAIFVHNINPIHDWVGRVFGLVVWNREWFMFDRIPNEWEWPMALCVVAAAIVAGLVGALLPAILAARKQPVESLRYE